MDNETQELKDVAKVGVEMQASKMDETLALVKALREEGAEVQVIIHFSDAQPVTERYEGVEIGDAKWRQNLQIPCSLSLEERNRYIRDRAVGAAEAFAAALTAASGASVTLKGAK